LLITVIGLSSLWAMRVERSIAGLGKAVVQARVAAGSFLEVALLRIAQDPDWRTTYTHDVWTTDETVDNVTYAFKLLDEQDGNLANDPNQPVRLYAKATVGDAVRIYSVSFLLEGQGSASGNMLTNPDLEDGLTGWSAMRCTIQSSTSNPHGGALCLEMTNGESMGAGPQQYVDGIENGVTYDLEVWARKASGTSYVRIAFAITSSGDGKVFFEIPGNDTLVGTAWTKCTNTLTPTWTGTLEEARVKFTVPSGTYDVFIDDAVLSVADSDPDPQSDPAVPIAPGSWRREVLP
jgi:hypothetical protein